MPRHRNITPRFSIRALLTLLLIACLSIALWRSLVDHQRAESELRRLRDELGHLTISEPDKIHFIAVPMHESMVWAWRVYLPGGHYQISFTTIGIPEKGFPDATVAFFTAGPEEFTVKIGAHRDHLGEWKITAMKSNSGHSQALGFMGRQHVRWLEGELTCQFLQHGQKQTRLVPADQNAELLRLRIGDDQSGAPSDCGIMVWIEKRADPGG